MQGCNGGINNMPRVACKNATSIRQRFLQMPFANFSSGYSYLYCAYPHCWNETVQHANSVTESIQS